MNLSVVDKLSGGKKLLLAGAGVVAVMVPVIVDVMGAPSIRAQSTGPAVFDATSIKLGVPYTPDAQGRVTTPNIIGGPGSKDPGRIHFQNLSLREILRLAYGTRDFQIFGPVWLNSQRFNVDATMSADTSDQRYRLMLQSLLVERFHMEAHHEERTLSVYSLVVLRTGARLGAPVDAPTQDAEGQLKVSPDGVSGLPRVRGGAMFTIDMYPAARRMVFQARTTGDLASALTEELATMVTDATGLTAKYDFTLNFERSDVAAPSDNPNPPPYIFTAVQEQLGLKLEPGKAPVDTVVIDRMDKMPTVN